MIIDEDERATAPPVLDVLVLEGTAAVFEPVLVEMIFVIEFVTPVLKPVPELAPVVLVGRVTLPEVVVEPGAPEETLGVVPLPALPIS